MLPMVYIAGEMPDIWTLYAIDELPIEGQWTARQTFVVGTAVTVSLSEHYLRRLKVRQGVVGFLICIAGFISIKITSPVSHMISSAVRGIFQSLLGMWFFHEIITTCAVCIHINVPDVNV